MNFGTTSFLEIIAYKACTLAFPFGNVPAQANPAKVCVHWDKVKKKISALSALLIRVYGSQTATQTMGSGL